MLLQTTETFPYYYVYDYQGADVAELLKQLTTTRLTEFLYNWPAVNGDYDFLISVGSDGICPSGWHIPSDGEWQTMEISLGMSESEAASAGIGEVQMKVIR